MNRQQLVEQIRQKQSYLCVGLDTDVSKLPSHLRQDKNGILKFNQSIIDATKEYCISYKINTAFYESMGVQGWNIIEQTLQYIPSTHLKIADAKRGDIGNTSAQYAKTFFEIFPFDAVTVTPYMGEDSVRPFLEYENKWTIVLGVTSNKGSEDFQRLMVQEKELNRNELFYEKIVEKVATWGTTKNLMFVVGATQAPELKRIRNIVPDHFLLVPGVGTQGGSLEEVSKYGLNHEVGLLVNVSRAIIYAGGNEQYATAASLAASQYQAEMKDYLSKQ